MSTVTMRSPQLSPSVYLSYVFLALLYSVSAYAFPTTDDFVPLTARHCGSKPPSAELLATHEYLHAHEQHNASLWNASTLIHHTKNHWFPASSQHHHRHYTARSLLTRLLSNRRSNGLFAPRQVAGSPLYTVDTYMHVVADPASADANSTTYITDTMIAAQFTYLSQAYMNASIAYRLLGITRTTNATWAANGDDLAMKTALRRGTYSALNIYYQSQLQEAPGTATPGVPAGSTLLGYCSLPAGGVTPTTDASVYVLDGCNVLSQTMPGGSFTGYNLGGTTAHEVGHWNGLLHPFQDNTCSEYDFGDYVADTPQELTSTTGCPASKDTCPDSGVPAGSYTPDGATSGMTPYGPQGYSGPDPIHNYMDYSSDACYTSFTPGQGARMLNVWQIYRQGL